MTALIIVLPLIFSGLLPVADAYADVERPGPIADADADADVVADVEAEARIHI